MTLVHIACSARNAGRYLDALMESLVGQTHADWALWIRDVGELPRLSLPLQPSSFRTVAGPDKRPFGMIALRQRGDLQRQGYVFLVLEPGECQ